MKRVIRSVYGPHARVKTQGGGVSLTKQCFREECDINNILRKFNKTGQLPEMIKRNPIYGDFSEPVDYQEALNIVLHADEQFRNLPARVRERFGNDPKRFLEFVSDPSNGEELVEMGLATRRPSDEPSGPSEGAKKGAPEKKEAPKGTPPAKPEGGQA